MVTQQIRKIPNDISNEVLYAARETIPGVAATTGFFRINAQPDITSTPTIIDDQDVTGTYVRKANPAKGMTEHAGTWGGTLSFERLPSINRLVLESGGAPSISAAPAYTYAQQSALLYDDVDTYTLIYGVAGDLWRATGVRLGQYNIEGAVGDANATWRFGSTLQMTDNDQLPQTEITGTPGTNEVQTVAITGGPTGGTFTLTYAGQTTAPIAYNATAAAVQSALEALSNIAVGDVAVTGGPLPGTAVTVTFTGLLGSTNVALMTATGSLTGGTTPAVTVTETIVGVSSGSTSTTLVVTGAGWTVNQFEGAYIYPDRDTNLAGARLISGNTATSITVTTAFDDVPRPGDRFLISGLPPDGIAPLVEEKIRFPGTKLFLDPYGADGSAIGTTQILQRFIGFNVSWNLNLDAKMFAEDVDSNSGIYGRGELVGSGQIRLEADRPDEFRQLKRLDQLSLRIEQLGSELAPGVRKLARIDCRRIIWTARTRDTRNNNRTQTMAFWIYEDVPYTEITTRNGLSVLP